MDNGKDTQENIPLSQLYQMLLANNIVKSVEKVPQFYDDIKCFLYMSRINVTGKQTDGYVRNKLEAFGVSLTSPHNALQTCLGESLERFALCSYKQSTITSSGTVKGYNLATKKPQYIPAQLVYLNYKRPLRERKIPFPIISTGAACHTTLTSAILNGIYEIVERDAFMSIFLLKIPVPKIDVTKIRNEIVQRFLEKAAFYRIELRSFLIVNDTDIPVIASFLIDRTGLGPALTMGIKANNNTLHALIGSIEEALIVRPWIRRKMMQQDTPKKQSNIHSSQFKRALIWSDIAMVKKLDFLFQQKKTSVLQPGKASSKEQELLDVTQTITNLGYSVSYVDITPNCARKLGFFVVKVFIPGFQPLYLQEQEKFIEKKRLEKIRIFFNSSNTILTTTPHPFL